MEHRIIAGKITNIGERTRKSGKTHIDHLVIAEEDGTALAYSNVVCDHEIAKLLSVGDQVHIGIAVIRKRFGGAVCVITALKNGQFVHRNTELSATPAIMIMLAGLLIGIMSRGWLLPVVILLGFYLYFTYQREKEINDLSQTTYDALLKLP